MNIFYKAAATAQKIFPKKISVKSKSPLPRNVICKIDRPNDTDIIYIIYVKLTNILPIKCSRDHGLRKDDCAGIFSNREYAKHISECLNKIISIRDDRYKLHVHYHVIPHKTGDKQTKYHVMGTYYTTGDIKKNEYTNEIIIGTATNKAELDNIKNYASGRNYNTYIQYPSVLPKIYQEPQIHVKRYRMNDVMPTMNLDDYDLDNHKKHLKIITNELAKHHHTRDMKAIINELEYAPPSTALKRGGKHYQDLVSDPEFIKRWSSYDQSIK